MKGKRWSRRTLGGVALVAVLLAFAGYGLYPVLSDRGEKAPDFSVRLLNGGTLSLSDLRGQVVLVNFWATWCPPCRLEMPGFERVYEARHDDGFTIVGLTTDLVSDEQIDWFLKQRGIAYPIARATGLVARAYGGANTLPTSYLIDAKGRIRQTVVGAFDQDELTAQVDALLREAGHEPTGEVASVKRGPPTWTDLKGVGELLGDTAAPVSVVEFSDYGCTYCSRFTQTVFPQLYADFVQKGTVKWIHVPILLGKFPNGEAAAATGTCAKEQGDAVYWPVHFALFRRQAEWKSARDPAPVFRKYVTDAGGDGAAFDACYHSGRPAARMARTEQVAMAAGVAATPTFFINGQRVEGAAPLAEFQQLLQQAQQ